MTTPLDHRSGERGSALISALIAVGIIVIVAMAIVVYVGHAQEQRKALAAAMANGEVEQAIQGAIIRRLQDDNMCFNPAVNFKSVPIGSYGTMQYTTSVPLKFNADVGSGERAPWGNAQKRCLNPKNGTTKYFCVKLVPPGGDYKKAAANSFMKSENAFAEIYVDTRNMQTGALVACGDATTKLTETRPIPSKGKGIAGGRAYYTMYWTAPSGQGLVLKNQTGVIYIGH